MTQIRLAEVGDIEGIRALMKKYHRDTISDEDRPDGFVTTAITDGQLTELIEKERGVMIIRFLFCGSVGVLDGMADVQAHDQHNTGL